MSFWSRFSGGKPKNEQKRLDYLSEGLALERQGDYDAALTSYALALRDQPTNHRVLQNMAIAYSRTGRQTEAIRCYRRALEDTTEAFRRTLRTRIPAASPRRDRQRRISPRIVPHGPARAERAEASRWIRHARETLERIKTSDAPTPGDQLQSGEFPEVSE